MCGGKSHFKANRPKREDSAEQSGKSEAREKLSEESGIVLFATNLCINKFTVESKIYN